MSSINLLFAGTIALSLSCLCVSANSPAYGQNLKARVEKDSVHRIARPTSELNVQPDDESFRVHVERDSVHRIARPAALNADAPALSPRTPALNAALNENTFALGADANSIRAGAAENPMNARIPAGAALTALKVAYPNGLMPRFIHEDEFQPLRSDFHAPDVQPQQAVAVDYNAVERAYAESGRQIGAVYHRGDRTYFSYLPAYRFAIAGTAGVFSLPATATATPASVALSNQDINLRDSVGMFSRPVVDTDNCACNTAIPSATCMSERTSPIYGASYAGPARMVPFRNSFGGAGAFGASFGGGFGGGFGGAFGGFRGGFGFGGGGHSGGQHR